ncbi:hypothetical protein [Sphingomonas sp.]|uniref:hypothetical protein n=1 Tax=Sphingomonas sp. TaxID=28214 RepID=UPI002FC88067
MTESLQDQADELRFAVEMSIRYHRRRAAFLEATNNLLNLMTLAGGAGAFVSLFGPGTLLAKLLAVLVTGIGIIRIVYSPQACAIRHKEWLSRWMNILHEIKMADAVTIPVVADWTKRTFAIEGECVIEMRALQADCYNRTARALSRSDEYNYDIRWWHRLFMHVIRFEHAFEGPPRKKLPRRRFWLFGKRAAKQLQTPRDEPE